MAIGNIRAYEFEGGAGCAISADIENVSNMTYDNYPITIILYDEQNQELARWENLITLLPNEATTIDQYYLDDEHNNLLNFKKYMIIGS